MSYLTDICNFADKFHFQLYQQYAIKLALKKSSDIHYQHIFLSEDCFIPTEAEECYPTLSYHLNRILMIFLKLNIVDKKEIHSHLRRLHHLLKLIENIVAQTVPSDVEPLRDELKNSHEKANYFLSSYAYKLEESYIQNSALLSLCILYESVNTSFQENTAPDKKIFFEQSTQSLLSLADIANRICQATSKSSRDIQFIAIGVDHVNQLWATTNYHSPVVYPLHYLLSKEKYLQVEKLRTLFRNNQNKQLNFTPTIHAETMIAALKENLNIHTILLIDGAGRKAENCPFCAHFLCIHGFTSAPHMQKIENYMAPSLNQLTVVMNWIAWVAPQLEGSDYSILPNMVEPMQILSQVAVIAQESLTFAASFLPYDLQLNNTHPVEQVFDNVAHHYPFAASVAGETKTTYHQALQLAQPNTNAYTRSFVHTGAQSKKRHPNKALRLLDDDSLTLSEKNNCLKPTRPDSPRSCALAHKVNQWLSQGDPSIQFVEQENKTKFIVLRR